MKEFDHADPWFNAPGFKRHDDGTFTMISDEPPVEKVDVQDYMNKQVKILNNGDNIIELIKTLPLKASYKLTLFSYIEKRKAEKVPQYIEFLGCK